MRVCVQVEEQSQMPGLNDGDQTETRAAQTTCKEYAEVCCSIKEVQKGKENKKKRDGEE